MLALACALGATLALVPGAYASSASYFSNFGVGAMTTARLGGTAAPLSNGEVLIAGGSNGSVIFSNAEIFNPLSDTFTSLSGAMTTTRWGAMAAPLPDGQVLIAGGDNSGGSKLSSAELFDPASDTFTSVSGAMTDAREGGVAVPLSDGEVLIVGGNDGSIELPSAELFDPASDTFASVSGTMTITRQHPMGAPLPDGDVLIAGGTHSGALSSAEIFDPLSDTFTSVPGAMTTVRYAAMIAPLPDGDVLIAGGASSGVASSAEIFDPSSDTFTSVSGALTTQREGGVAAPLPNGGVLIAGGENGGILGSAELFYPAPLVSSSGGGFGAQTVGEPSALQAIRVSNLGAQSLLLATAKLEGVDAADFTIVADGCAGRSLSFEGSCTISVRFTPSEAGTREASLTLSDNAPMPSVLALQGTGVPANSGPTGPPGTTGPAGATGAPGAAGATGATGAPGGAGATGATGAPGATGATGATGSAGALMLVTCYTATTSLRLRGHKTTVNHRLCSTVPSSARTVAGKAGAARATLERGHRVYAVGTGILNHHGHLRLLLSDRRTLKAGRYTLILLRRSQAHWITTRLQVTVG
ncbi:MAG: choice-of-anchor D domain-containing protein [Solirubrobacteraceae bacterium]